MPRLKVFVNKTDNRIALSNRSKRDSKWTEQKSQAETIGSLYNGTHHHRYYERMKDCCGLLEFKVVDDGRLKLKSARFCKTSRCPLCCARKALLHKVRIIDALPRILDDFPSHRFIFATFTVKNCSVDELSETITAMNKGFERMSKLKAFPAKVTKDEPLRAGLIRTLEYTRAKDDKVHPHYHALIILDKDYFRGSKYLSHAKWQAMWKKAMRLDYDPQVHIKAIKPNNKKIENEKVQKPLLYAISEVVKYNVKGSDLAGFGNKETDRDWLLGITDQLHYKKTISMSGIFKKYIQQVADENKADLINIREDNDKEGQTLSDESLYFKWFRREQNYFQVNN